MRWLVGVAAVAGLAVAGCSPGDDRAEAVAATSSAPAAAPSGAPSGAAATPGVVAEAETSTDHPGGPAVTEAFRRYADAINTGRYELAWRQLTANAQKRQKTYDAFADSLATSYWLRFDVAEVRRVDANADEAVVAFRTVQEAEHGPGGQTCSDWRIRYRLVLGTGELKIDRATALGAPEACTETLPAP